MILVLDNSLTEQSQHDLCLKLQKMGFYTRLVHQYGQVLVSLDGPGEDEAARIIASWKGIAEVIPGQYSYYLSSRRCQKRNSIVKVGSGNNVVAFGGDAAVMIAGPCAIESEAGSVSLAKQIKAAGGQVFRGMIFKPRSSPYSFQGLGKAGIPILRQIREQSGMLVLTEVRDPFEAELVADHVDIIQIGTRNMSNFQLLKHLGQIRKPLILKRGMGSSIEELLCAA
ncbi:MAG TPA: 3-deoxy-7-phosphoheptulonate synthase, partial [Candidatus Rifleibacterium sp.]|nr:3-deoxy-7-phosphoheptulonate synthase [Candidatus Rifleibacterium sp.]